MVLEMTLGTTTDDRTDVIPDLTIAKSKGKTSHGLARQLAVTPLLRNLLISDCLPSNKDFIWLH